MIETIEAYMHSAAAFFNAYPILEWVAFVASILGFFACFTTVLNWQGHSSAVTYALFSFGILLYTIKTYQSIALGVIVMFAAYVPIYGMYLIFDIVDERRREKERARRDTEGT